jgi:hypothetical protein
MINPFLIAALVTVLAHHIQNPEADAPSSNEMCIYQQLFADLDVMVQASDNSDLEEKRNFCKSLSAGFEVRYRAHTVDGIPGSIVLIS